MVTASGRNNSWSHFHWSSMLMHQLIRQVGSLTSSSHDRTVTSTYLIVDPPTISNHGLITCTVPYACPASPVFTSRKVRGWKKLDREEFRAVLSDGPLCQDEEYYAGMSASELFDLYSTTIRDALDRLAPLHDITSRHNPSTPWFDAECRSIKRAVRLLERRYRRTKDPVDRLAWINALREKHSAFKSKENSYWENTVKSNSSNPKKLWRSVSTILGEPAKQSANLSTFSASDFLDFLEQKVESVRSDTAGSAPPSFSSTTCTFTSFSLCSQELVRKVIGGAASKSCELDPAPTFLIKEFLEIHASIPHKDVQRLSPGRSFAVVPDNCHCDTGIEETKFGSKRYEELSPDFEPLLHVEGRGENRCSSTIGVLRCKQPSS